MKRWPPCGRGYFTSHFEIAAGQGRRGLSFDGIQEDGWAIFGSDLIHRENKKKYIHNMTQKTFPEKCH